MKEQTFSILNFPLRSVDPLCCCLVAKSCPKSFVILWTVAHQAPLSVHGISQARILEYKLLNQNDDFSLQLCKLKIKKKKKPNRLLIFLILKKDVLEKSLMNLMKYLSKVQQLFQFHFILLISKC